MRQMKRERALVFLLIASELTFIPLQRVVLMMKHRIFAVGNKMKRDREK